MDSYGAIRIPLLQSRLGEFEAIKELLGIFEVCRRDTLPAPIAETKKANLEFHFQLLPEAWLRLPPKESGFHL